MKRLVLFFIGILGISMSTNAKESNYLILDLASMNPFDTIYDFGNMSFEGIMIKHAFPFESYYLEIQRKSVLLDPLIMPKNVSYQFKISPNDCSTVEAKLILLEDLKDKVKVNAGNFTEKTIYERISELKDELSANPDCNDQVLKNYIDAVIKSFNQEKQQSGDVGFGDQVTISIYNADKSKIWTWIFIGKDLGKWVTTYGFGFTSAALEGATYYSKQITDSAEFQIKRADHPDPLDFNYIPAVFFSFFPSQRFEDCWNHSLTAGLGFDLTAPVVFFGYNGMFYHNIGLSIGVALQEQHRLKSQYSQDEIISSSLDKDQLHDEIYRPNLYFAIHFRFGENPFKKDTGN